MIISQEGIIIIPCTFCPIPTFDVRCPAALLRGSGSSPSVMPSLLRASLPLRTLRGMRRDPPSHHRTLPYCIPDSCAQQQAGQAGTAGVEEEGVPLPIPHPYLVMFLCHPPLRCLPVPPTLPPTPIPLHPVPCLPPHSLHSHHLLCQCVSQSSSRDESVGGGHRGACREWIG